MINLMINEFKKIFSKQSTYIILITIMLLIVGVNLLNKYAFYQHDDFKFYEKEIKEFEKEIARIEKNNFSHEGDVDEWIYLKEMVERAKIINSFDKDEMQRWKIYILESDYELFTNQYKILEYQLEAVKSKDKKILESDDYKNLLAKHQEEIDDFMNIEQDEYVEYKILENEELLNDALLEREHYSEVASDDKMKFDRDLLDIENDIKFYEQEIKMLKIRKEKNIPYDYNNYMHTALNDYDHYTSYMSFEEPSKDATQMEKRDYYMTLKNFKETEYILETEENINDVQSGKVNVMNTVQANLFFYMVIIIVLAGNIVAEEYANGTIKNLFITPHKRGKILTSKILVLIISTLLILLVLLLVQVIVSGIIFDFKSMLDPVVEYNVSLEEMQKTNLFIYVLKDYVFTLPLILVFLSLTLAASILTASSAAAITVGIMSFLGMEIVNQILLFSSANWIKYFPTMNWNWNEFLSADYHSSYGINITASIIITIFTYALLLIPAYIIFKKRDIKNI